MAHANKWIVAAMISIGIALSPAAQAQTFPNKRFTIVVASSPGGSFDIMARIVAERLRKKSDQAILVENRPGANDTLAMGMLVAAPNDGHMIAFAGNHLAPVFLKAIPYDPAGITPVSILSQAPYTVVASKASNLRNLSEFVAYAKANPGKLTLGAATGNHFLDVSAMAFALGIEANLISYKGIAPVEAALLSGEINGSLFGNLTKVRTGQITGIVTGADTRNPEIPDVPTFKELGINHNPRASYSVWARSDTPADLLDRLNRECQEVVQTPEWTERITKGLGIQAIGSTREFAKTYLAAEFQSLKATANRVGINPQ